VMTTIGGKGLDNEAYEHRALRRRLKSLSRVYDVLLTSSFILPAKILSANLHALGSYVKNFSLA
jgi:hypothetical protein